MLLGDESTIAAAQRFRVWYGSGWHQGGFSARAAHYALDHHLPQLAEHHRLTQTMAKQLGQCPRFEVDPDAIETNMLFLSLAGASCDADEFCRRLEARGVLAQSFPPDRVRFVFSMGVTVDDVVSAANAVSSCMQKFF